MSKRTDRREAERTARKLAYQELRNQPPAAAQVTPVIAQPEPESDILARAQAFFQPDTPKPVISEAQLAANRANAQLSSGPKSSTGKAISSQNNFRHGLTQTEGDLVLLESESHEDYSRVLADFQAEWKPGTPTERDLVERLASRQWLRRRALKLQKLFLAADGLITDNKQYELYRRYESQHERSYNKALADLIRLRSLRLREQIGFESQRRQDEAHVYKIQALKDREMRNRLAVLEAEGRLTLVQSKLLQADLIDFSSSTVTTDHEAGDKAFETHA